ncbi:MAG TPA: glycosyltransferase family 4 protein [Alphaproteobacteria bacterium]|nr:glycosyltransferase family 4 protein [Alphaproteobacteria bacterium]
MRRRVAVIVKGYPRLSETFIAQEIAGLERRGLEALVVSLRRPADTARHSVHDEIAAPVLYLPEYLHEEPRRVLRAWRRARSLPGYAAALRAWRADLRRDPTRNRARRFGQALVLACELPRAIEHLYAHFLHTPASVARYASLLTGLPWSCSAHAKDIWTTPAWEKREKLASLDWLVTCTRAGAEHLAALTPDSGKVELVYHGLDLARFPPPPPRPPRDGRDAADPVVILSVGRLVEKKGYGDLLAALARLPPNLAWRFVHIGGGAQGERLRRQAAETGLAARITWLGPQPQAAVLAQYRQADLFALACRTAADGDRDGLPNVLMEAQSQGLACLSTTAGAVPELITADESGLLVLPGDVLALARALEQLIRNPALRARLGAAGARRVRREFSSEPGLARLAAKLGLTPEPERAEESARCALPFTRR